jgi:beta-lactamase regulating signal transducer with metallopeptidase domain
MLFEHFVVDALRVAVVLGFALLATVLLRRRGPAARRIVLATALAGALVMPVVSAVAPAWGLPSPVATTMLRTREVTEALVESAKSPVATPNATSQAKVAAPSTASTTLQELDWRFAVALVWALGSLLVLARLTVGLARSRALVRGSTPAHGWWAAIGRAERITGLRANVRVTDAIGAPAVTGIVKPVVLVPRTSESWDDRRRLTILVHELAHVRQRDCLLQLFAQLACALHWFDPLVWIAARRLRLERELAADEAVLAAGTRASHYAEELLAIVSATWAAGNVPSGALGMGERSHLATRITAIVAAGRIRRSLTRVHAASLVGACTLLVVAAACTAPTTTEPRVTASATLPAVEVSPRTVQSTVQPALQKIADEELDRLLAESSAEAGTILVLDPSTGEILADAGKEHGAPADVAVRSAYVTGSTLKAVTLAAALDDGVVSPDDRFHCEHGTWSYQGQVLHDWGSNGLLTLREMVAVSSNIGFAKVFDRMGGERLGRWLRIFHFGSAPPVDGATAGWIPGRIEDHSFAGATAAIGEAVRASPLQVAAAYAAIANGGEYIAPTRTRRTGPAPRERLMKAETARRVADILEGVVYDDRSTGKRAQVEGLRVAGKTGTASWDLPGGGEGIYASFVGFVPSTAPRYVILVGVEQPKGETSGGEVAAPVFGRVAARTLSAP